MLPELLLTLAALASIAVVAILAEPSAARLAALKLCNLAAILEAHATARDCARYAYSNAFRSRRALQAGRQVQQ